MDFVSLADGSERLVRAAARHLAASTSGYDDDGVTPAATATATAAAPLSPEAMPAPSPYSGAGGLAAGESPLLSPSAEDELFLLATNFLLYVAMVIITTMVCRIYFPGALERGSAGGGEIYARTKYQRAPDGGDRAESDSYYGSDAEEDAEGGGSDGEEEEDDEEELLLMGGDGGQSDSSAGLLLDMEEPEGGIGGSPHRKSVRGNRRVRHRDEGRPRSRSFLEFDQDRTSQQDVMKRLGLCVLMLNLTFVTWGVLQERMLTRRYPRGTGEYFTYSYALVFSNRFWTLIMSGALLLHLKPRRSSSTVIYEYSFPSISNMLSSWCQYEALKYVSFPTQTLFKSFKLAPVMAMGKILGNKEYPQYDYVVAIVIGIGVTMYTAGSEELNFGYDVHEQVSAAKWTGIMLLLLFLFFDSFTSQWQSRMFQRHRDLSMIELMFATSAFSTVLAFITLVHEHELGPFVDFVVRHKEIQLHFFMFSICSTIGQLFIFYTIKNFGAVVFTIIMTTRVLLSIALSCYLYGHKVGSTGFLGLMVVMGAVCYRIKRKAEGKQLIRWQGIGDEKAQELVQEWHEHADM